jgi:hypothetical protein
MVNYADAYGIHSLAAAIIFLVIYTPFVPFYIWTSVKSRTFVYYMLTLFCVSGYISAFQTTEHLPERLSSPICCIFTPRHLSRFRFSGFEVELAYRRASYLQCRFLWCSLLYIYPRP